MIEEYVPQFILVDDDPVANLLVDRLIKIQFPNAIIHTFTDGEDCLKYISAFAAPQRLHIVLFLDINMLVMDGWDFLNAFTKLPQTVQQHFFIYMLSSSGALMDTKRAMTYTCAQGYLIKPLTKENLQMAISGVK